MFLKKKEKDPSWSKKKEWEWELQGAQHRPGITQNYIGQTFIQDPSRTASLVADGTLAYQEDWEKRKYEQEHEEHKQERRERRQLVLQRNNKGVISKTLNGLGGKLFGEW
jgi:hypothetical protein